MTTQYTSKHSDISSTTIKPRFYQELIKLWQKKCFASATTDIKMLLMLVHEDIDYERDCNYHRQSDITYWFQLFGYCEGNQRCQYSWGFSSSFIFTKSSPQWEVFVMTQNHFRFPKWKHKKVWAKAAKIHCPSVWTFTANRLHIFSVHVFISYQCFQYFCLVKVTKPL